MVVAALLIGLCGCSDKSPGAAYRHVFVIVLDATHAAHVSCYGGPTGLTPNIDRLASAGVRFDRAFSNHTWTLPSTTALFTGRVQERHGVVTDELRVPASAELMAERFQRAGYRSAGFVQMIYASQAFGLDQGFDHYNYYGSKADLQRETMNDVVRWVDGFGEDRTFTYLHLRRPHSPYDASSAATATLEDGCELADGREDQELRFADGLGVKRLTKARRQHVLHLYRSNLAAQDHELGPLIDRLLARDDALIVLLSDHGEELGQHGYYGHGPGLTAEAIDIPLVVVGSRIHPGVDVGPACTVDVLPTLLDLCGIAGGGSQSFLQADGISLAPRLLGVAGGAERPAISISARYYSGGEPPLVGVVKGDRKLLLFPDGQAHLFDRRTDREDRRDALRREDPDGQRMLRYAREFLSANRGIAEQSGESVELTDDQLADLKALGYVR